MVFVASLVFFAAIGPPVVGVVQANDMKVDENVPSTLTSEAEERISNAVDEYLSMTGYNPLLRRFGRNWWNSRRFIATVIDVGLIAVGIGAAARSRAALASILRNHRTLITRVVNGQILRRVGIGVTGILMASIRFAATLAGTSIGGAIAWGLDRDDGRLDGYILA